MSLELIEFYREIGCKRSELKILVKGREHYGREYCRTCINLVLSVVTALSLN